MAVKRLRIRNFLKNHVMIVFIIVYIGGYQITEAQSGFFFFVFIASLESRNEFEAFYFHT